MAEGVAVYSGFHPLSVGWSPRCPGLTKSSCHPGYRQDSSVLWSQLGKRGELAAGVMAVKGWVPEPSLVVSKHEAVSPRRR